MPLPVARRDLSWANGGMTAGAPSKIGRSGEARSRRCGAQGSGERRNRNRLAFLAVDQPVLDDIQVVVRKRLAWASIVRDTRLSQLPPAQEDDAKKKEGEQASAALCAPRMETSASAASD
jgi:hypothetical protein